MTAAGILTSLLSLSPSGGILLSVGLLAVEQFIERTVFYWTTMYLQPMPNFDYDDAKWDSMAFIVPPPGVIDPPSNCVGLVFTDPAYATNLFELLRSWNYGDPEDRQNNIRLSFIVEEDHYFVLLYPAFDRPSIRKFHSRWRKSGRVEEYGKEHFGLIVSLVICKEFSAMHGFGVGRFAEAQRQGEPFLLIAFLKAGPSTAPMDTIPPIRKWNFKYKHETELERDEFERVYLRMPKRDADEGA